jgi:hypothetical protein
VCCSRATIPAWRAAPTSPAPEFAAPPGTGRLALRSASSRRDRPLRAIQPTPAAPRIRPALAAAALAAVLGVGAAGGAERGAAVLLYPEIKHPPLFAVARRGRVEAFVDSMARCRADVEVWVQCFDAQALRRVHEATGLPAAWRRR